MDNQFEEMAKVCKALGHPIRLNILDLLAKQEEYYCGDIVSLVGMAQSTVSHHLKILKDSGLVETEERGTFVCYRVRREKMEELSKFLLAF
ncbi:metalloregulator ArsR/SmtB family transcription factor [Aneurinibacillus thermoaerophilus]|nr:MULTISPECIES: metalloregulator ArsR/SmtB family transcription factor [Aneurinibacillus]MED0675663.1 metalloregulator ArsR/SmtB family transcription factor [Aneurinibacillus thermoaerophilus]MED0758761.1 metalloregulator ArsR/SmtB family transcription factor [Aneurinibacillus thermoaerophilus]MED0759463.1 metalloregulator ArsR/SmtB family transcription factor [Aneurinibacillus thermoaerophilus]QYY41794.1 metalloregulator ArsR/SmtB family transcription factor [Aneurinibacillus thermoaerophilus